MRHIKKFESIEGSIDKNKIVEDITNLIFEEQNRKEYGGRGSGPFDLDNIDGCRELAKSIVSTIWSKIKE